MVRAVLAENGQCSDVGIYDYAYTDPRDHDAEDGFVDTEEKHAQACEKEEEGNM